MGNTGLVYHEDKITNQRCLSIHDQGSEIEFWVNMKNDLSIKLSTNYEPVHGVDIDIEIAERMINFLQSWVDSHE